MKNLYELVENLAVNTKSFFTFSDVIEDYLLPKDKVPLDLLVGLLADQEKHAIDIVSGLNIIYEKDRLPELYGVEDTGELIEKFGFGYSRAGLGGSVWGSVGIYKADPDGCYPLSYKLISDWYEEIEEFLDSSEKKAILEMIEVYKSREILNERNINREEEQEEPEL